MAARYLAEVTSQPAPDSSREVLFPDGLVGCAHWRHFIIQPHPEVDGILVMQSSEDTDATFVLAPVAMIAPSYLDALHPDDAATLASLGIGVRDDVELFCTLNVRSASGITANLLGPLVIDSRARVGRQVVLSLSTWSARHDVTGNQHEQDQG
jgi:flagellar assembly factor FliW